MPDFYFHYTSRQGAQGVVSSGRMEAGANALIYLTLDRYGEGAKATDALAIEGKPVEFVAMIPQHLIPTSPPASVVLPVYDPFGKLRRHGGGSEITVPGPVQAGDIAWFAVSPP